MKKKRQAAVDAAFSRPVDPSKPPRLPLELMFRIIRDASKDALNPDAFVAAEIQRRSFLLVASRVCSAWRDEAQRQLWKQVVLASPEACRSFLLGAQKGLSTLVLGLTCLDGCLPGPLVGEVLIGTSRLQALSINYVEDLDLLYLASPSLSGEFASLAITITALKCSSLRQTL